MTIQDHTLQLHVYVLPITCVYLVLEVPLLKTLCPHIEDYNALYIKFYIKDIFVTFLGDKNKNLRQAQSHHIKILHNNHAIDASFTLQFKEVGPVPGGT